MSKTNTDMKNKAATLLRIFVEGRIAAETGQDGWTTQVMEDDVIEAICELVLAEVSQAMKPGLSSER